MRIKNLILAAFIGAFTMISCGEDDEIGDDLANTFLERFDGIQWENFKDGETENDFIIFNDNVNDPIDEWVGYDAGRCFEYLNWVSYYEFNIIENSYNTFKISMKDGSYSEVRTYTVIDDVITFRAVSSEGEDYGIVLEESTQNLDDLNMCHQ